MDLNIVPFHPGECKGQSLTIDLSIQKRPFDEIKKLLIGRHELFKIV